MVPPRNGRPSPAIGRHLFDIMSSLPKTDVELGSVVTLGFGTNGLRDPMQYIQHVQPKVYIPGHMTAVARESSSLEWKVSLLALMDASGFAKEDRPEIRWLVDPNDYLRPLVFDPKDERWAGDGGRPQQDGLCK